MTQGPEDKEGKKKRKVPKTMIFGVDLPKDEPASPASTEAQAAAETAEPTESQSAEKKRKVPKTLLFETQGAMEAAVLEAAAETDKQVLAEAEALAQQQLQDLLKQPEPAEPQQDSDKKRKVPKTLLFDTAALKEKAAEIDSAANAASNAASNAAPAPESAPESAPEPAPESASKPETAKRKVPKTLLFDPAKAAAAAQAAEEEKAKAEAEAAVPEPTATPKSERKVSKTLLDKDPYASAAFAAAAAVPEPQPQFQPPEPQPQSQPPVPARDEEAAPELNIDGPDVKLFFEVDDKADEKVETVQETAAEKVEEKVEEKPKRKVPRTLLFNPVIGADGQEEKEESAANADAPRRISTRKIAKTLLNNRPSAEQIIAASQEPPLDEAEAELVVERYIARTMLDHSILFDQLSKSQHHAQEKAEEEARERLNEPFKPFIPIECKKEALACPFTWDPTYAKEKYRYCDNCQRPVYNFAGLEIAEAEAIILKAENRAKFTLYKRTDGLYMTSDCPVAVKKRSDTILISVGGFLLALSLVAYMAMLPKPAKKPPVAPPPVAGTAHPNTDNIPGVHKIPTSGGKRNVDSWVRDANGKLVRKQTAQPVGPPPVQQAPPPVSQPEDQTWEFPNGEK